MPYVDFVSSFSFTIHISATPEKAHEVETKLDARAERATENLWRMCAG